jgi:tRNA (mo5U34)-methyltransferase
VDDIERLAPWMYEFELGDGTKTPLLHESLRAIHATRRSMIVELLDAVGFEPAASVLDLGCNEGYFSFELAKRGAREVLGLDARARNIEKAELVRARTGLHACRFEVADVTERPLPSRAFDLVLLLGLIYHVEDPIRLIRRAAGAARKVLIVETQLTKPHPPIAFGWGSPQPRSTPDYWAMLREDPAGQDLNATRGFSLVPSAAAVVSVLREIGFRSIMQLHPNDRAAEEQYVAMDRAVFAGWW